MALKAYGAEGANLTINNISIETFGQSDPAISIEDIQNRAEIVYGLNGGGLRLDNATRPKRVTVNLLPDSDEVHQLLALEKSGADMTFQFSQTGTGEREEGFDGVLQSVGPRNRAGKGQVSDEQFVFIFTDGDKV